MANYYLMRMAISLGLVVAFSGGTNADESKSVRDAVQSYVDAFNKHDAKSVAEHWTKTGEFVTPAGMRLHGRKQIEAEFAAYFDESGDVQLEIDEPVIEILSPHVAKETGFARVVSPEGDVVETNYVAIHVKMSDGWKMDSVREDEYVKPYSHYDRLRELDWIVGEWVDASENATVAISCQWTKNQNFITRSFKVHVDDRIDLEGTQVIGWDPVRNTIRSWIFNSEGGFGVGAWTRQDNRWIVRSINVLPSGLQGSATIVFEQLDQDTFTFHTIGREVDGELLPNLDPVRVVRK